MSLQFKAQFNYIGLWTTEQKRKAEIMLYKIRNEMVNTTNPVLEEFNSEWNKLHPEINGMDEGSPEWNEYNKFIAEKCNEHTLKIRTAALNKFGLKIEYDPEMDGEIVVINSNRGKAFITLKMI